MPQNPSSSSNASSRFEAVLAEIIRTEEEGRAIDVERYCRSFPEFAEQLRDYFRNRSWLAPILCTRRCESRINRYRCVLGLA